MIEILRRKLRPLMVLTGATAALLLSTQAAQSREASVASGGVKLAYVTGDGSPYNAWVRPLAGGAARAVGHGGNALLSPDGRQVAVTSFAATGAGLQIYPTSGARPRDLYDLKKTSPSALSWSFDSRYLAVYAAPVSGTGGGRLDLIDTKTGTVTTVIKGTICGASFAPNSFDELVFAKAKGYCLTSTSNLYMASHSGSYYQTSFDGRSAYPVWGARGIAFDRFKARGNQSAPIMQIWFREEGKSGERQVTHVNVPPLLDGLQPLGFSAGGYRLLAQLVGQDTDSAYAVNVSTGRSTGLIDSGYPVQPEGISRDGKTVLVDYGAFENVPTMGRLETMPFNGGRPKVLVRHSASGSWNK